MRDEIRRLLNDYNDFELPVFLTRMNDCRLKGRVYGPTRYAPSFLESFKSLRSFRDKSGEKPEECKSFDAISFALVALG